MSSSKSHAAAAAELEMGTIWDGLEPTKTKTASTRNLNGDIAALNATMYGYGGHGAYIPMPPPQKPEQFTFWDEQKIQDTVKRKYVVEHIGGHRGADNLALRKRLDTPMSFGDGLTESTYVEWIVEHAPKFFLVLLELGVPEKIFQIVDGSWDDEDLPLTPETVVRLGFENQGLEKRFLKKQHIFLLRLPGKGDHVDYLEEETVAMEVATSKRIGMGWGATSIPIEKVYFPRARDQFYMRAEVPLGTNSEKTIEPEAFLAEIDALKDVSHKHIISIYASYTHQDYGYLLLSPACELNLSQFIRYTPYTFKSMPKLRRRRILLEWLHCLADALAYLYDKGVAHKDIRPRSILIDQATNNIFFADIGNFKRLDSNAKQQLEDVELYEYAAPELWQRALISYGSSSPSNTTFIGRAHRKASTTGSPTNGSVTSISTGLTTNTTISSESFSPVSRVQTSSTSSGGGFHLSHWVASSTNPSKSDVFSLGCVSLDIISFLMKRRPSAFISHRSKRQRRPRQNGPPDQSFHANLGQVESWIEGLEIDAEKKNDLTLTRILRLVRTMLEREPGDRPQPRQVSHCLYKILEAEFVQPVDGPDETQSISTGSTTRTSEYPIGEGPLLHCKPTMDPECSTYQLGLVAELKLWPTTGTTRTGSSTISSSSASSGLSQPWTGEVGDEQGSVGRMSTLDLDGTGGGKPDEGAHHAIGNGHSINSGSWTKSLHMKKSVGRLFGFAH